MKRLIIGDHREKLLSTLETLLKHWGYRVLASSRPEQLEAFLQEIRPDVIIMGARFLTEQHTSLKEALSKRITKDKSPLVVLAEENITPVLDITHDTLKVPVEIFTLFELIQRYLEKYPRKNLRLALKLPSMLCKGETSHLAEIMSLSTHGLFIKTSYQMKQGDHIKVILPLIGMKKELELEGRVLYHVSPDPENNYLEGVGVEFTSLNDEVLEALHAFIENRLLDKLTAIHRGARDLSMDQIRTTSKEVTLKLARPR